MIVKTDNQYYKIIFSIILFVLKLAISIITRLN